MDNDVWRDPIVEEIHRIREKMSEEAGHDINVLVQKIRETAIEHPERMSDRKLLPLKLQNKD